MAGRYKIFLGMAAGVGKTYRMLQEGQAERRAGRDVVIGILETHGRADTAALAEGLEVVPRRRIAYREAVIEELDLPGILVRAPELCLVDELAHTNMSGCEHAKRHEDIAHLLAADIDVHSTVNVQHLESLNDQVHQLTGVRVRETFPDRVLAEADEVVLVDVTPEALVARLRDGKIYPPARVPAALTNFFRVENLQALREIALRQVAEEVEAKRLVRDSLEAREAALFGGTPPQPIAERLLALVGLDDDAERVIRRAWRSAQRLSAELDILVVRSPEAAPDQAQREALEGLRRLASMLGAHLLVEGDADVVDAAERVARERNTTYLLTGPPPARRGLGRLAEPALVQLVRRLPGIDVRVVNERAPAPVASRPRDD